LARKKKSSKKKRSRKKASAPPARETGARVEPAPDATTPSETARVEPATTEPTHDAPPSAEPAAAGPARVEPAPAPIPVDLPEDEPLAIDLDEDLDADGDGAGGDDAVRRLIAEALAGGGDAAPGTDGEDLPVIDLDDEPPPEQPRAQQPGVEEPTPQARPPAPEATPVEVSVDLGPVSSPAMRDRLLAEALAHAEHKEARYRVPYDDRDRTRAWKSLIIVTSLAMAGVLATFPPAWVRPAPPAMLTAAEQQRSLRTALLLQAQQIDAYRIEHLALPPSLDTLPARLPGLRYVRTGNRAYQLMAYEDDGRAVVYDSADPIAPFDAIATTWVLRGMEP